MSRLCRNVCLPIVFIWIWIKLFTFEYSNLKVTQQAPLHFEISFDVENTGKYDGEEVAQLYIRDEYASVVRALRQLKHFKRFFLKQGEKKTIVFTL